MRQKGRPFSDPIIIEPARRELLQQSGQIMDVVGRHGRARRVARPTRGSGLNDAELENLQKNRRQVWRTSHCVYLTGRSRIIAPTGGCVIPITVTSISLPSSAAARTT